MGYFNEGAHFMSARGQFFFYTYTHYIYYIHFICSTWVDLFMLHIYKTHNRQKNTLQILEN